MRPPLLDMLLVADEPISLIQKLNDYTPTLANKWPEKRDAI
jgi:hypothetical protein